MKIVVPLVGALIALAGCLYEAPITLEPPREIDRSLLGAWQNAANPDDKFVITEEDPTHYKITASGLPGLPAYRAHHTQVGTHEIINVASRGHTEESKHIMWNFYGYTWQDRNTLRVRNVKKDAVPVPIDSPSDAPGNRLKTPEAMKSQFESAIKGSSPLWSQVGVFKRVEPRADAPVRNPGAQAALRAWTTGMRIGDIAPTFLMKADSNPARNLLRKARAYASTIYHDLKAEPEGYGEISIPDLPSKTGSRVDDFRAIMKFLAQSKVGVASSLGDYEHEPWGFEEIDCYKMAICAQTARLIYTAPGHGELVRRLLEDIQEAGKGSGLPDELWQSVVQKGKAAVPADEFGKAIEKMNQEVTAYLEARLK